MFWIDDLEPAPVAPALVGQQQADLVVVGGGYTGLWAALQAKEEDPGRDVLLLEARTIGWAASGRNGGFCSASLTHGEANGLERWPQEFDTLQRLGAQNLDGIEQTLTRYGVDAEFERTGSLDFALEQWQAQDLRELTETLNARGGQQTYLDADQAQAQVHSPLYTAAMHDPDSVALVHPMKLARALRTICEQLGVRIHEHTEVTSVEPDGAGLTVSTGLGTVRAAKVLLGTNVSTSLLRRLGYLIVPVYDHALVTEPLTEQQLADVGWQGRQGLADCANQFHYYRLTADNRILWGGYDAVYHFGSKVRAEYEQNPTTFGHLADQFFANFPQLEGLSFTHRWGGAIDTCSRFTSFWGTAHGGRMSYVAGYTGLGVGSSRFGARVALDLVDGVDNERTRLEMVRSTPLPFPPEPLRWIGIELTRRSMAAADRNAGRRNLWLRTLDSLGLGFDS